MTKKSATNKKMKIENIKRDVRVVKEWSGTTAVVHRWKTRFPFFYGQQLVY